MSDIFISYASGNRGQAHKLASALEISWDGPCGGIAIITGQAYDQLIERELNDAESVVVLWSSHSVASEWVKNEAAAAAERGVLLPVLIGASPCRSSFGVSKQPISSAGMAIQRIAASRRSAEACRLRLAGLHQIG